MRRERALEILFDYGGIVIYGGNWPPDNVFLARACGAHAYEHLCHTRNFLAAGGA
jgi:hypothetical protein